MFTAILTFLKTRVFTLPGIFIAIPLIFIAVILAFNTDTILSKFNFETRSNLKGQVATLTQQLNQVQEINKQLSTNIETLQQTHKQQIEAITRVQEQTVQVRQRVQAAEQRRATVVTPIQQVIQQEMIIDKEKNIITLPMEEVNQVSKANIQLLNEVYSQLFG